VPTNFTDIRTYRSRHLRMPLFIRGE